MTNTYICAGCHGRGTTFWVDGEDGTVEEDKCGFCVGRGLPPSIKVPTENDPSRAVIDVVANPCAEVKVDTSPSGSAEILPNKEDQ